MNHNLSLIKALVTTLHLEIDTLENESEILIKENPIDLCEKVRNFEIKMIKAALLQTGGNQSQAAKLLKIKTSTLNNKIKQYKIDCLRLKPPADETGQ
jgi:DNA-binding NtrC family response regulator